MLNAKNILVRGGIGRFAKQLVHTTLQKYSFKNYELPKRYKC